MICFVICFHMVFKIFILLLYSVPSRILLRLHWPEALCVHVFMLAFLPVCGTYDGLLIVSQVHTSWRRFKTQQGRRALESGQQWQHWSMVYRWHWLGNQSLHGAYPHCWMKESMQALFWRGLPLPSTQGTRNSSLNTLDRLGSVWIFYIYSLICVMVCCGSAADIATGYGLDDRGVRVGVPIDSRIFTSPYCRNWPWDHPAVQWLWGIVSQGAKQQGHKADHSLPASVKVKKTWTSTCTLVMYVRKAFGRTRHWVLLSL
jgi:hypothetical protein